MSTQPAIYQRSIKRDYIKARLLQLPCRYCQEPILVMRRNQDICKSAACRAKYSVDRQKTGGPFPYTCIGCNKSFTDGLRRNQSCCGAEECIKARDHQFALERAETARETREVRETKVRDEVADQIARIWETKRERSLPDGVVISESWADQCEAYYTAGLTPLQVKARAIKNAARLAEIRAGFARLEGKR